MLGLWGCGKPDLRRSALCHQKAPVAREVRQGEAAPWCAQCPGSFLEGLLLPALHLQPLGHSMGGWCSSLTCSQGVPSPGRGCGASGTLVVLSDLAARGGGSLGQGEICIGNIEKEER